MSLVDDDHEVIHRNKEIVSLIASIVFLSHGALVDYYAARAKSTPLFCHGGNICTCVAVNMLMTAEPDTR